jgi:hypothetical protein
VSEWLKEHAWKVCIPQKGIVGSNPILSADSTKACKSSICRLFAFKAMSNGLSKHNLLGRNPVHP